MAGRASESFGGLILTLLILALILILAVFVSALALFAVPAYVGFRLWKESPKRLERLARDETLVLYNHALAGTVDLSEAETEEALSRHWPADLPPSLRIQLLDVGKSLFKQEGLSSKIPLLPALCNTVEGARYRDRLAKVGQARNDPVMVAEAMETISQALAPIADAVPSIEGDVLVEVTQFTHPLGQTVQNVIAPFFADSDYMLFRDLRQQLNANLTATHRSNPVYPVDYKNDDLIDTYLRGTPLKDLFKLKTPFAIPDERRFEHMHMVAGSGHGKTQTLQYFIAKDLEEVARRDRTVVVIDSQGDLINTILKAKVLPSERIVLIDPEDIAYPVCLNLFSVGQDRLESYDPLERERLTNSIIELYDFVLGSLLAAGMTAKQSVVFRYVTRLMFHIPEATIHTLRELMEPEGTKKYQKYIARLEGTPRRFFESEFNSKEFANTKTQVLRRLYGVLENQTFERAVPMSFPFFVLENLPRATKEEIEAIRQQCREAYAEPWSPTVSNEDPEPEDPPEPPEEKEPDDPLKPSPEL